MLTYSTSYHEGWMLPEQIESYNNPCSRAGNHACIMGLRSFGVLTSEFIFSLNSIIVPNKSGLKLLVCAKGLLISFSA